MSPPLKEIQQNTPEAVECQGVPSPRQHPGHLTCVTFTTDHITSHSHPPPRPHWPQSVPNLLNVAVRTLFSEAAVFLCSLGNLALLLQPQSGVGASTKVGLPSLLRKGSERASEVGAVGTVPKDTNCFSALLKKTSRSKSSAEEHSESMGMRVGQAGGASSPAGRKGGRARDLRQ